MLFRFLEFVTDTLRFCGVHDWGGRVIEVERRLAVRVVFRMMRFSYQLASFDRNELKQGSSFDRILCVWERFAQNWFGSCMPSSVLFTYFTISRPKTFPCPQLSLRS